MYGILESCGNRVFHNIQQLRSKMKALMGKGTVGNLQYEVFTSLLKSSASLDVAFRASS
jgi:hypothetical protein